MQVDGHDGPDDKQGRAAGAGTIGNHRERGGWRLVGTFSFPSVDAPAVPPFSVDGPEGWVAVPAPGVVLAVAAAEHPGAFRPNITVSSQRVVADLELDPVADRLLAELKEAYDDLTMAGDWRGTVSQQDLRWQEYAFTEPKAGTLFQIQVVLFAPLADGAAVKDLFHVHATCAGADAPGLLEPMRSAVRSLRFPA
jgi:hypothetical protein